MRKSHCGNNPGTCDVEDEINVCTADYIPKGVGLTMVLVKVCEQMKESRRRVTTNKMGTGRKCANVITLKGHRHQSSFQKRLLRYCGSLL